MVQASSFLRTLSLVRCSGGLSGRNRCHYRNDLQSSQPCIRYQKGVGRSEREGHERIGAGAAFASYSTGSATSQFVLDFTTIVFTCSSAHCSPAPIIAWDGLLRHNCRSPAQSNSRSQSLLKSLFHPTWMTFKTFNIYAKNLLHATYCSPI
ncbi:hypothetical protein C8J56DRAFT_30607 [Mycena floridula]|nr:hypothetical protein C8J56DRAFT_30607 [Mycena floridula]